MTSAIAFALSAIAESEQTPVGRRSTSDPAWSIEAETPNFAERDVYDGSRESLVQFMMRAVHEIRPLAFHKKSAKPWIDGVVGIVWKVERAALSEAFGVAKYSAEAKTAKIDRAREELRAALVDEVEPAVDWSRLWVGHPANRQILWTLDAALRSRLYGAWWEGQTWLDWKLPPRLEPAREAEEEEEEEEESARVAREEDAKKRRAGARAPDEGDDAIIPL